MFQQLISLLFSQSNWKVRQRSIDGSIGYLLKTIEILASFMTSRHSMAIDRAPYLKSEFSTHKELQTVLHKGLMIRRLEAFEIWILGQCVTVAFLLILWIEVAKGRSLIRLVWPYESQGLLKRLLLKRFELKPISDPADNLISALISDPLALLTTIHGAVAF